MTKEYLNKYPKNPGNFMPLCSEMDFTSKLGPLPIYVKAPKNTDETDIDII